MNHHFKFHRNGTSLLPDEPTPLKVTELDSLKFSIPHGRIHIQLDHGHGFNADHYDSGGPDLRAERRGRYTLHCSAHLDDGTDLGWSSWDPGSGTDVIIISKGGDR